MKWKKTDADGTGPVGGPTTAAGQMMYDSEKPSSEARRSLGKSGVLG